MSTLRFNRPQVTIAAKPVRGIREASIDIAGGAVGQQLVEFTRYYYFNAFGTENPVNPGVYGSLLHGNIGSNYIAPKGGGPSGNFGTQAYFDGNGRSEDFVDVDSPPDTGGQSMQNPVHGANLLSFSLNIFSTINNTERFRLSLFRICNSLDTFVGIPNANINARAMRIAQWGPIKSTVSGSNDANFVEQGYMLPAGTGFFFEVENVTNALSLCKMAGSIFLHG